MHLRFALAAARTPALLQLQPSTTIAARAAPIVLAERQYSAAERAALRLPNESSNAQPRGAGLEVLLPLMGDGEEEFIESARYRVRRRQAAAAYNSTVLSRSLPLPALLAQVGGAGSISVLLFFCFFVQSEAAAGSAWAVDALVHSDEWAFGLVRIVFGEPPAGPLAIVYAAMAGAIAISSAPLLFDRLLVAPWSPDRDQKP